MTCAPGAPARWAGVPTAARRGAAAFLVVAGLGQVLAFAFWLVVETGASIGTAARIGWMYFGAFHHVAIELDVRDLDVASRGGPAATSVSVGVALLSATLLAVWLLFRAGRAAAEERGGSSPGRVLVGAAVAPTYALPSFALALLVRVDTPLRLGAFASGALRVSLMAWQALAFPLAVAAVAGAAGGLRSALGARGSDARAARLRNALAGGVRMFALAVTLSFAGLLLAGVVQPDGPAALLTPSTARYLRATFSRPGTGVVLLGHHLLVAPNEALWTLVPAMGGCDGIRGRTDVQVLCYRRFPLAVDSVPVPLPGGRRLLLPLGGATFGTAPLGYLAFLLVPGVAVVLGGRRAVVGPRGPTRHALVAGGCAGLVFAGLVGLAALLSTVTIRYGAAFAGGASGGHATVGPEVVAGTLLAAAWGVVGGALGAATAGSRARVRRASRTGP